METKVLTESLKYLPYIVASDNKITDVSYAFTNLTEIEISQLIGMDTNSLCDLIRLSSKKGLKNIKDNHSYYIFTKSLQPREVNIIKRTGLMVGEQMYIFLEKPNSRLEEKIPCIAQYCSNNIFAYAVLSIPDRIILASNQKFYNQLNEYQVEYKCILGKKIDDILSDFKFSFDLISAFKKIAAGKTVEMKEAVLEHEKKGIGYGDILAFPVYSQNVVKYCVVNIFDVTDKILYKKRMDEQSVIIGEQSEKLKAITNEFKTQLKMNFEALNIKSGLHDSA